MGLMGLGIKIPLRPIAPMVMPIIGMKALGSVAPVLTAGIVGGVTEIVLLGRTLDIK